MLCTKTNIQRATYIDGLENHTTTTHILILHHFFGMFAFLLRTFLEVLVESLQCNIVTIKVPGLSAETL